MFCFYVCFIIDTYRNRPPHVNRLNDFFSVLMTSPHFKCIGFKNRINSIYIDSDEKYARLQTPWLRLNSVTMINKYVICMELYSKLLKLQLTKLVSSFTLNNNETILFIKIP